MQINRTAEKQNDRPDDHTVTPPGARPAKAGAMRLVTHRRSTRPPTSGLQRVGGASLCRGDPSWSLIDHGASRLRESTGWAEGPPLHPPIPEYTNFMHWASF